MTASALDRGAGRRCPTDHRADRSHGRDQPARHEGAGAAGQDGVQSVLEDSARTRLSFETAPGALGRRDDVLGRRSSVNKGGVCATPWRRWRRWASMPSWCGTRRAACRGCCRGGRRHAHQRWRRLARPSHPGVARRLHRAHRPRLWCRLRRAAGGDRRRHQAQPGGAACSPRSACSVPTSRSSPATLLPPDVDASVSTDFDALIGEIDVCYLLRMQNEG